MGRAGRQGAPPPPRLLVKQRAFPLPDGAALRIPRTLLSSGELVLKARGRSQAGLAGSGSGKRSWE